MTHTIFNERPESQDRAIKLLEKLGYTYVSRSDAEAKRGSRRRVLFEDELQNFLSKRQFTFGSKNFFFSSGSVGKAIRALDIPITSGLSNCNKDIYDLLCGGKSLEETLPDGSLQSFDISYIDFENPENNIFQVTDEFDVERTNGKYVRPDIVVMINGIPLAVIECKRSGVDVWQGVRQHIRNWGNDYIPHLFKFSQMVIAVNPYKLMYGTVGTPESQFVSWREDDKDWLKSFCRKCSPDGEVIEQDRTLVSLLEPNRFLELIRHFVIYDNNVKKIARYKQFFAVKKCLKRIKQEDGKETRGGVLWHTQGSGKTIIMIMLTKLILSDTKNFINPRFVMITDRINLDKQIRDNFINTKMEPIRAATGTGLIELLKNNENTVITALVNKFETAVKMNYSNSANNIFLFIDEGHRSHYGSLNLYMTETLPNAVKIAFTGTPLFKETGKMGGVTAKNTYHKFGPLIDHYSMEDAISDSVIVPILYEGRVVKQEVTGKSINDHLKHLTVGLSKEAAQDLEQKWSRFIALAQTRERLAMIAFNLYEHFIRFVKPKKFKAMLTCSSRAACVEIYYCLKKLSGINPAVVITPNNQEEGDDENNTTESLRQIGQFFAAEIDPLYKNDYAHYEDTVTAQFVDPDGDIDLLIVKDKLLTGFDAPVAAVLYIDKKMQDHTLYQAIARVNRIYPNKEFGLIVDYYGVFKHLNSALDIYGNEQSGTNDFDPDDMKSGIISPDKEKAEIEARHRALWEIFAGIVKNEKRPNVWHDRLIDDTRRKQFYLAHASFGKWVDFLFTSYELFKVVGKKQAYQYRKDYYFFKKLKDGATLRFNERILFSDYEDGIRQLLNTYVKADDPKILIDPLDIFNKNKMQKQLSILGSKEARADAIKTRQVAELETKRYEDPALYMTFMDRINKTIEVYLHDRDEESYLAQMETMAEDYREGRSSIEYPESIVDDSDAKAFYSSILSELNLQNEIKEQSIGNNKNLAHLALEIKNTIKDNAKRDWRENIMVHRSIKSKLDDLLFNYMEENNFQWEEETIDLIIEKIMLAALKRF
ncbi:MAG: HsdR family type I site-specific deoxyribonuclease [Treponema sp.]|jgi:type I restriction enzyme R subunit|nr:HsdR family type I site-specific deoxyribonuclease [Treponema sp.]